MSLLRRNRAFRRLILAYTLALLTSSAASFAIPIEYLTRSGDLAGVALLSTSLVAAGLAGTSVGGIAADTLPKRTLLMWGTGAEALGFLALTVIAGYSGTSTWMWVCAGLLVSGAGALSGVVESASIRAIVDTDDIAEAGQSRQARSYLVTLGGPALGGVLLSAHPMLPFVVGTVGALVAVVLVVLLSFAAPMRSRAQMTGRLRSFAVAGLRALFTDKVLLGFGVLMFVLGAVPAIMLDLVVFTFADAGAPPWLISAFPVAIGVGGTVGSTLVLPLVAKWKHHAIGVQSIFLFLILAIVVSAMAVFQNLIALSALAVVFTSLVPLTNPFLSFLVAYVPENEQGRVLSTMTLVNSAPALVAPAIAAALVRPIGLGGMIVPAVLLVMVAALVASMRSLRRIPVTDDWASYIDELRGAELYSSEE